MGLFCSYYRGGGVVHVLSVAWPRAGSPGVRQAGFKPGPGQSQGHIQYPQAFSNNWEDTAHHLCQGVVPGSCCASTVRWSRGERAPFPSSLLARGLHRKVPPFTPPPDPPPKKFTDPTFGNFGFWLETRGYGKG